MVLQKGLSPAAVVDALIHSKQWAALRQLIRASPFGDNSEVYESSIKTDEFVLNNDECFIRNDDLIVVNNGLISIGRLLPVRWQCRRYLTTVTLHR